MNDVRSVIAILVLLAAVCFGVAIRYVLKVWGCKIGLHKWMYIGTFGQYSVDQCKRCSKRRFWYQLPRFAEMEVDMDILAKMLDGDSES